MAESFGLAFAAARLTGLGMSQTARTSTHFHTPVSSFGVGVRQRTHLDDADDLLVLARMIEKAEVAQLHGFHVVAGDEIAHARPRLALLAARLLHLPGVLIRLRLEQPVGGPGPLRRRRRRRGLCLGFFGHGSESRVTRLRASRSGDAWLSHCDREQSGDQGVGQSPSAVGRRRGARGEPEITKRKRPREIAEPRPKSDQGRKGESKRIPPRKQVFQSANLRLHQGRSPCPVRFPSGNADAQGKRFWVCRGRPGLRLSCTGWQREPATTQLRDLNAASVEFFQAQRSCELCCAVVSKKGVPRCST